MFKIYDDKIIAHLKCGTRYLEEVFSEQQTKSIYEYEFILEKKSNI